jgi:hypothetical protein
MSPALVAKRVSTRIFVRSYESHDAWSVGSDLNLAFNSKLKINLGERRRCYMFASAGFDPAPGLVVNVGEMQASLCLGLSKDPLDMVIWVFCYLRVQLLSLLWLSRNPASPIITASSTCVNVKGAAVTARKTKEASGRWGARTLPSHSSRFVSQLVKGSGWVY